MRLIFRGLLIGVRCFTRYTNLSVPLGNDRTVVEVDSFVVVLVEVLVSTVLLPSLVGTLVSLTEMLVGFGIHSKIIMEMAPIIRMNKYMKRPVRLDIFDETVFIFLTTNLIATVLQEFVIQIYNRTSGIFYPPQTAITRYVMAK